MPPFQIFNADNYIILVRTYKQRSDRGHLVDFTEDKIWLQVIENYNSYRHVETVGIGNLIPREPFRIAVKLLMRLSVTAVLISYY